MSYHILIMLGYCFVTYYLFVVKVCVTGVGIGVLRHIGYGDVHQTCCPRKYEFGNEDFLQTRIRGWTL